jgi:hypothetical protein
LAKVNDVTDENSGVAAAEWHRHKAFAVQHLGVSAEGEHPTTRNIAAQLFTGQIESVASVVLNVITRQPHSRHGR